jgi:hypothetical protein
MTAPVAVDDIEAVGSYRRLRSCLAIVVTALLGALVLLGLNGRAQAEVLSWNSRPAVNFWAGGTDSATVNGVAITSSGTHTGTFDAAGLNQHEIQPSTVVNGYTGFIFSIFNSTIDDSASNYTTTTISFGEPVYNVSFLVSDIDGGPSYDDGTNRFTDIVEFRANGTVLPTSGTPVDATRVSWNSGTGRATSISNVNLTDATSSITITFAGPVNSLTIRHIAGPAANSTNPTQQAVLIEDITFQRSPRLALQKTSVGDVATFDFTISNGPSGNISTSLATVVPGTPVTGPQNRLGNISTDTTVTETGPSAWAITSTTAACSDANAANSGNPAAFSVAVSGNAYTVPSANIRAGAEITCAITNSKLPTVRITKVSSPGVGTFEFSGTNGFGTDSITTVSTGVPAQGSTKTLSAIGTSTTITEGAPAGFFLSGLSCTGMGSGSATYDLAARSVVLDSAATAAGNAIQCTFTNTAIVTSLTLTKTADTPGPVNVDDIITYTYEVVNSGTVSISNVNLNESFNGYGVPPAVGSEALFTDVAPIGDSTDGAPNDGVWQTLGPGDVIRFLAQYQVVQSDIDFLQ